MSAPDLAVPTEFIDGKWCFPVLVGQEPSAVVTYANVRLLTRTIDDLARTRAITVIIHGNAPGADTLAAEWAQRAHVPVEAYPADWRRGRGAGPERNARMLAEGRPDLVVAFPGARGTADMVRRARAAGVRVVEVVEPVTAGGA